jgi:hypothetical protein
MAGRSVTNEDEDGIGVLGWGWVTILESTLLWKAHIWTEGWKRLESELHEHLEERVFEAEGTVSANVLEVYMS